MKTIERAHMPSKLWERIKLSENYVTALKQIDDRLIYWPNFLIHKCKQRLTRLVQVGIQSRKLAAEEKRLGEKLVGTPNKVRRRERTRERKALAAAKLERSIEKELVERLRSGAYGDKPLNVDESIWKKVLKGLERQGRAEGDMDEDELESEEDSGEEEEEEEEGEEGGVEYVSGDEELEEEEEEEVADLEDWLGGSGASEFEEGSEDGETDSEDDSEDEDESSEDEALKKGAKVVKKGKVDDSKKRKREKTVQQPRKRRFHQALPHQACAQNANMSPSGQAVQESKSSTKTRWRNSHCQRGIWRFRHPTYNYNLVLQDCGHQLPLIFLISLLDLFCLVADRFAKDILII